jgi:uncharacterized protein YabN with tetrapyrrole methylase and pyrophosphatase domain
MTPHVTDLYLLGAGVAFPEHLTIQTIDILSSCARVCTNLEEPRLRTLPSHIREKCISLWPLYQDGRLRSENYRDVTQAVLNEAERERPTAWLTPGHPVIFDSVSKALLDAAREREWNVCVVPAISSLDTLLAEVTYDPANGLLVQDATGLVRQQVPLSQSVALVLLQIAVFLSDRAHVSLKQGSPDLGPLRDYLVRYYPPAHRCAVIRSSMTIGKEAEITWMPLTDLPSIPVEVFAGASLFVPPIHGSPHDRPME